MGNASYVVSVVGSFIVGAKTVVLQINAPNNATVKVKRVRIHFGDGTKSFVDDTYATIQYAVNNISSNGTIVIPPPSDANDPPAQSIVTVLTPPVPIKQIVEELSIHSNTPFHWQAKDEDDKYVVTPGNFFVIMIDPVIINPVNTTPLPDNVPDIQYSMTLYPLSPSVINVMPT